MLNCGDHGVLHHSETTLKSPPMATEQYTGRMSLVVACPVEVHLRVRAHFVRQRSPFTLSNIEKGDANLMPELHITLVLNVCKSQTCGSVDGLGVVKVGRGHSFEHLENFIHDPKQLPGLY